MSPRVALLTASIPTRAHMLSQAIESVAEQTVQPKFHHIGVDHAHEGAATVYNRLARTVGCCVEWVTFLDDDDLLFPEHLETLGAATGPDVDVVYSGCEVVGSAFCPYDTLPTHFDEEALASRCTVPITAMVRLEWFNRVGGFPAVHAYDHELWKNLAAAGAKFKAVPEVTWQYRIHGHNRSRLPEGTMA
jgi:hypothetical protein